MPGVPVLARRRWAVSSCSIVVASACPTGSGSAPAWTQRRRTSAPCLMPQARGRVVLFGASEGGPACIKFAADHPDRVAGLILFASLAKGSAAPDYPHALQADQYDAWLQQLVSAWGGPAGIETFAPSLAGDAKARAWWAGLLRAASSPGAIKGVLEALARYGCAASSGAGCRSDPGAPPPRRPRRSHRRRPTSRQPHPAGAIHRARRRRSLGLRRRSASGA